MVRVESIIEKGSASRDDVPTTPWKSVYVATACSFIQEVQSSILLSSMWPYLKQLNPNAEEVHFGYVITMYSLGQCISAPSLGYWSNRIKQVRLPLLTGFSLMMAGNLIYLLLSLFTPSYFALAMMAARFVHGCGTGNVSLVRAYVLTSSSKSDRPRALACFSGGIAVGTVIGPAFQLLFTSLGPDGIYVLSFFRLSVYNSPALLSMLLNLCGFLIILLNFEEKYDVLQADAAKLTVANKLPQPCVIAVVICLGTRFVQIFMMATIETAFVVHYVPDDQIDMHFIDWLGSAFSMLMFSFSKEQAVATNATAHLIAGILGVLFFLSLYTFKLSKWMPPRPVTLLSIGLCASLFIATYPWPFLPTKVDISKNGTDGGCFADRFDWCNTLPRVSPWVYYTFYALVFGIAFSAWDITGATLYTEIIGPRRQGTHHGMNQLCGSVGKVVSPIITSKLYSNYGPKGPWIMEVAQLMAIAAVWTVFWEKMVPLEVGISGRKESSIFSIKKNP